MSANKERDRSQHSKGPSSSRQSDTRLAKPVTMKFWKPSNSFSRRNSTLRAPDAISYSRSLASTRHLVEDGETTPRLRKSVERLDSMRTAPEWSADSLVRVLRRRIRSLVAGSLFLLAAPSRATAEEPLPASSPPPLKKIRYDETYDYLRSPDHPSEFFDPIKFIPFDADGIYYLTLGGDIRERYEYYHNNLWGRGPQDQNGYLLQRYMVHADVHLGDYFRLFAQFKSGLEDGRNGGSRPTDRDEFDLHQAFLDFRIPLFDKDSLTIRVGRQELAYGSSRLISIREEPNVRRSFDGVKTILKIGGWQIDAFAVRPVRTK